MANAPVIAPRSHATGKTVRAKQLLPQREAEAATPVARDAGPTLRRFSVDEYLAMADAGLLLHERTELIEGKILAMTAQKSYHATSVALVAEYLREHIAGSGYHVRNQVPGRLADDSMPEPDIMLARGSIRDYTEAHPTSEDLALVVEVSDTTLRFDRTKKLALYARAKIADYWIVNVADFLVEVYREPRGEGKSASYGSKQTFDVDDDTPFAPLVLPDAETRAADLLP